MKTQTNKPANLLRDLMAYTPDVIYFKDTKGKLIMVNQAHAKGLGLKPEQVAGKSDFDFFPKERAALMAKDDVQVLKTGKAIIDKIERATRSDGVDNYVSTTKIPRFDAKGKIIGLIGITRDITRRMQLERFSREKEQIEKQLHSLEELNKLKSEFVSVVSHELRTPLAIIKEAVALLSDEIAGPINDKQRQLLITAALHINNLKGIIEDLLDISRIESGKLKLHYSLVNLNDLLSESSEFFKKKAQEKGVRLEYALSAERINLFLDAEKISRVVTNLLNNAIKFTEENGKIRLEVKVLQDKVRIGVIDTGIGIAKADLEKLFQKFVQVSHRPNLEKEGLGLGLSIARGIVQIHGGEIWAESQSGVGSKFYFTLSCSYALKALEKNARLRINALLDKGISLYLVNLLIVNYKLLKSTIGISPARLFKEIKPIISATAGEFSYSGKEPAEIVSLDAKGGEAGVIFPEVSEKEILKVCALFKSRLKEYFTQVSAENVFINIGLFAYPQQPLQGSELLPANLRIKKIFIGHEIRHFKRFLYKLNIEVIPAGEKTYLSKTVDISQGGVCFILDKMLKTDAEVDISLELKKESRPLHLKGRVAWLSPTGGNNYKIGVEFINLSRKEKQTISRFIKSISAEI
ncbi:MAG: ATP-binding protein [Candidatus Omnitrophica bacterium]|jgi:PAS domain S-box-containing protein|nr:ATP-binding protein [Candidatus Omnitrophota bacterium]